MFCLMNPIVKDIVTECTLQYTSTFFIVYAVYTIIYDVTIVHVRNVVSLKKVGLELNEYLVTQMLFIKCS